MADPTESPEYAWLQEYKRRYGAQLRRRHGAHALGISWKRAGGKVTDRLALTFYVASKAFPEGEPVPPEVTFTPAGADREVKLPTDVVEAPPAVFEQG